MHHVGLGEDLERPVGHPDEDRRLASQQAADLVDGRSAYIFIETHSHLA
jgi:hypothetical protein